MVIYSRRYYSGTWKGSMASIFNLNRIREHKAAPYIGKALVYGIRTKAPRDHAIALQAHDFVFNLSQVAGPRK